MHMINVELEAIAIANRMGDGVGWDDLAVSAIASVHVGVCLVLVVFGCVWLWVFRLLLVLCVSGSRRQFHRCLAVVGHRLVEP